MDWVLARLLEGSTWAGLAAAAEAGGQLAGVPVVGHFAAIAAGAVAAALEGGSGTDKLNAQ